MPVALDDRKLLPDGVHEASLEDVDKLFARFQKSDRRIKLFKKLRDYLKALKKAGCGSSVIINGSFVMACMDEPEDIDHFLASQILLPWGKERSMSIHLTPAQRQQLAEAPHVPVQVEDSATKDRYVILGANQFGTSLDSLANGDASRRASTLPPIPPGVCSAKEAFLRDLPKMLKNKKLAGKWVLYHGERRIGLAARERELMILLKKLGLRPEDVYEDMVVPHAHEPEQVDPSLFEFEQ